MRKLASIRQIANIRPIPGADRIVVAQVDGWECVVQKDEFHVGDHVVYVEVDSVMPERPEFEFLRDRKFRVRTIKLRGQVSQGLVLPLSILHSIDEPNHQILSLVLVFPFPFVLVLPSIRSFVFHSPSVPFPISLYTKTSDFNVSTIRIPCLVLLTA